jgi:hypothetical protein
LVAGVCVFFKRCIGEGAPYDFGWKIHAGQKRDARNGGHNMIIYPREALFLIKQYFKV